MASSMVASLFLIFVIFVFRVRMMTLPLSEAPVEGSLDLGSPAADWQPPPGRQALVESAAQRV
jgi:hypothetical protein